MKTTSKFSDSISWIETWSELCVELDSLCSFDQLYFPLPWLKDQWGHLLSDGLREFSLGLCRQEGQLLGFVLLFHDQADRFSHLVKIATHPDYKRQGLARNLFEQFVSSQDFERIYLEVEKTNDAACALYRSLGFTELRVLKDFYGQGRDGLGMLWLKDVES